MSFRVFIFGLISLVFFKSGLVNANSLLADENQRVKILNKAERFLRGEQNISDIGSLFLKELAVPGSVSEKDIPLNDAFSRTFNQKYTFTPLIIKRTVNSVQQLKEKLHSKNHVFGNYFYEFPESINETLVHRFDDVLIKTLYCDKGSFDDLDLAIVLSMRDFIGGYADTHGMLALLFLEGNNCFNKAQLKEAKDAIVVSLLKALENDVLFSDLYVERIACLYWAGVGHLVKKEWIERIMAAQRKDGGWANKKRKSSSVHTTGLAVLSINYYFGKKPYLYQKN